jgi:hypothetical protein
VALVNVYENSTVHVWSPKGSIRVRPATGLSRGVPEALECEREVVSVDGCAIELATGSRAEAIGTQVERAVYEVLR